MAVYDDDEAADDNDDHDGGDEDGGNEYGYGATRSGNKYERRHRQRRRRRSQGRTSKTGRKKSSSKVRPRAENLPMDPPRAEAGKNLDEYATAGAADKVDVIRGISSMSTSTVSFRSDDGVLPRFGNSSRLSGSGSAAGRSRPPKVDTSISARGGVGDLSHQQGLPVTPLLGKGALQQQKGRHALPPPWNEFTDVVGAVRKDRPNRCARDVTQKRHREPTHATVALGRKPDLVHAGQVSSPPGKCSIPQAFSLNQLDSA